MERALADRTIALAVTGSIAAYKAAIVARLLVTAGATVRPIMTTAAREFLGPATLSGITGQAVPGSMWDPSFAGEMHVALANEVDAILIVPATADVLVRLVQGRANDLVCALALVAKCPILVAPAMHPRMWAHPVTQRNVATLRADGRVTILGPDTGLVASGDAGEGRMVDPEVVFSATVAAVAPKDLAGKRLVISAGPTLEDLDPVRFLGNRSTGRMGFALAVRAAARGADTTLIAGPVTLPTPWGVRRVDVRSALEMQSALGAVAGATDAIVMTAAVADHRPAQKSAIKLKKQGDEESLLLAKNPDLIADLGAKRRGRKPVLVAFALETGDHAHVVAEAKRKLAAKKVDFVVANEAGTAFGGDENEITFVSSEREERLPRGSKLDLADHILDRIAALL
ncbi:bifunctional phosphopantothenoylcysteine decarboxylase/phosphopantothenate--cysteine ligase CoaBC [soil metagenome]